jgi:hypothetical protein
MPLRSCSKVRDQRTDRSVVYCGPLPDDMQSIKLNAYFLEGTRICDFDRAGFVKYIGYYMILSILLAFPATVLTHQFEEFFCVHRP